MNLKKPQRTIGRIIHNIPGLSMLRTLAIHIDQLSLGYKIQIILVYSVSTVILMYFFRPYFSALGNWGYLGAFMVNAASNATIIFPAPGGILVAVIGREFNIVLISLCAGLGATMGSSTAYLAGALNSSNIERLRWGTYLQRLMKRFGGIMIFLCAFVPFLPGDLSSLVAGVTRYSFRKWILFHGLASIAQMVLVVLVGSGLLNWLERLILGWM